MGDLINFDGNVTLGTIAVQVADALNPLAAARDAVVAIAMCTVEINRIEVERKRIAARGKAITEGLLQRQREVYSTFIIQQQQAQTIEVDRHCIRQALNNAVQRVASPDASPEEREMFGSIMTVLSGQLIMAARNDRQDLIKLVDALNIGGYVSKIEGWQL